jgi:hypothetical protein
MGMRIRRSGRKCFMGRNTDDLPPQALVVRVLSNWDVNIIRTRTDGLTQPEGVDSRDHPKGENEQAQQSLLDMEEARRV